VNSSNFEYGTGTNENTSGLPLISKSKSVRDGQELGTSNLITSGMKISSYVT